MRPSFRGFADELIKTAAGPIASIVQESHAAASAAHQRSAQPRDPYPNKGTDALMNPFAKKKTPEKARKAAPASKPATAKPERSIATAKTLTDSKPQGGVQTTGGSTSSGMNWGKKPEGATAANTFKPTAGSPGQGRNTFKPTATAANTFKPTAGSPAAAPNKLRGAGGEMNAKVGVGKPFQGAGGEVNAKAGVGPAQRKMPVPTPADALRSSGAGKTVAGIKDSTNSLVDDLTPGVRTNLVPRGGFPKVRDSAPTTATPPPAST